MLSAEQNAFLKILSDHFHKQTTLLPENINIKALGTLAKEQGFSGIVYYQTHLPEFRSSFASTSFYTQNLMELLENLHTAFVKAQIPYLIFKGVEIAKFYPCPGLRTMGDVDLLVHTEDKLRASELLEKLGFVYNEKLNGGKTKLQRTTEWVYTLGKNEIELHHGLLYESIQNEKKYILYSNSVWEYVRTEDRIYYQIDVNFHFIFLLLHLRKHFLNAGIGIRQFADIAVMIKNAQIDWERTHQTLTELGLLSFSKICFALIQRWFGICCPIEPEIISDDFYEEATVMVLTNGTFSFEKKSNQNSLLFYIMQKEHKKVYYGELLSAINKMYFPRYAKTCSENSKSTVFCHYLNLCSIPFAWGYRIVRSILRGTAIYNFHTIIKLLTIKKETYEKHKNKIGKWGL